MKVEYIHFEDSDETAVACPECGQAGDFCPSIHHWCCNGCGELLEENPNTEQWECWNRECRERAI